MKTSELMRGDWVCVYSNDRTETHPFRVNEIVDCGVYDSHKGFVEEKDIEPIPLTPEILEKNGFKEDSETNGIYWRPDCRKFCIVKELDTWYFAFRVLGETVDKSSGYICISECNYVHKLQHKLKDLEIEKEIVL